MWSRISFATVSRIADESHPVVKTLGIMLEKTTTAVVPRDPWFNDSHVYTISVNPRNSLKSSTTMYRAGTITRMMDVAKSIPNPSEIAIGIM